MKYVLQWFHSCAIISKCTMNGQTNLFKPRYFNYQTERNTKMNTYSKKTILLQMLLLIFVSSLLLANLAFAEVMTYSITS